MNKTRLEAFSDGVLAIIITIMVLEIKIPHSSEWSELKALIPVFTSYLLSFLFVGIYWGNHHHLLHSLKSISSGIIWGNLNLLFWLSLIPFSTGWMGENHFAPNTVMVYGITLLLAGVSFNILQKTVEKHTHDLDGLKKAFVNLRKKGIASVIGYSSAIPLAYVNPLISGILFFAVAILWIIPDKNIEKALSQ
ncbi:TMEM175 family protein [soil metagenome]